jgi:hypothetical protein
MNHISMRLNRFILCLHGKLFMFNYHGEKGAL